MQQELFEELQGQRARGGRPPLPLFPERVLTLRMAHEDLICGALILLLLILGGFCVGVERGKRLAPLPRPWDTLHLAGQAGAAVLVAATEAPSEGSAIRSVRREAAPLPPIAGKQLDAEPVPASSPPPAPQGTSPGSGYVIQLASYSGAGTAQAQAQRLRSRGVEARVIKQGKYFELRAVGYRSQEEARASLAALRKLYRDAFIKRVSSS